MGDEMSKSALLLACLAIILTITLNAQTAYAGPWNEVAVNPVFAPFGTLSFEYAGVLSRDFSAGVNIWYEYKDVEARFAYLKLLYNPFHKGMSGLSLGPTGGLITRFREKDHPEQTEEDTSGALGGMVQYNLLLGRKDNILLGIGFNAMAPLKDYADNSPLRAWDGDLRLMLGYAW
jgi:hypothetical protein